MKNFLTRKRIAAVAVIAAVLLGAVAAASARSEGGPSYRTAEAAMHTVDQVLDAVATIEPVSQATVAFPVAGTVDAVDVKVGQEVTIGSRLASLDVADLKVTVNEKQAALDQAELTLSLALAGEDVGTVSGGGTPSDGFGRPAASGSNAELQAAQLAVLDAQEEVDAATAAAQLAFDNASTVCSSAALDAAVSGDDTSTTAATTDSSATCLAALQAVLDAQAQVTAAQQQLTEAADALTALLDELATGTETTATTTTTTPKTPTSPTTPSTPGGTSGESGTTGSSGAPSGWTGSASSTGGASSGSSSPSAEALIAYQKQVDAAADELAVAEQAVDQATIVSPIDGTVAAVNLAVGDEVEAASATANIVVVGDGGYEVTTSISVKDLPDVAVGQAATVTPDGDDEAVAGEVVRIGVSADTSSSTATYQVTIGLTGDTSTMGNGDIAAVEIVTSAADEALAVPTSAVTVDGDRSTVQVVSDGGDGTAKTVTVETGAIGQTWTEITKGLDEGDEVVLADLDDPLPGSATDTSSTSGTDTGGGGSFPGGGSFTAPPGGMPSGGPTGN